MSASTITTTSKDSAWRKRSRFLRRRARRLPRRQRPLPSAGFPGAATTAPLTTLISMSTTHAPLTTRLREAFTVSRSVLLLAAVCFLFGWAAFARHAEAAPGRSAARSDESLCAGRAGPEVQGQAADHRTQRGPSRFARAQSPRVWPAARRCRARQADGPREVDRSATPSRERSTIPSSRRGCRRFRSWE